jgi:hypothetical protein
MVSEIAHEKPSCTAGLPAAVLLRCPSSLRVPDGPLVPWRSRPAGDGLEHGDRRFNLPWNRTERECRSRKSLAAAASSPSDHATRLATPFAPLAPFRDSRVPDVCPRGELPAITDPAPASSGVLRPAYRRRRLHGPPFPKARSLIVDLSVSQTRHECGAISLPAPCPRRPASLSAPTVSHETFVLSRGRPLSFDCPKIPPLAGPAHC